MTNGKNPTGSKPAAPAPAVAPVTAAKFETPKAASAPAAPAVVAAAPAAKAATVTVAAPVAAKPATVTAAAPVAAATVAVAEPVKAKAEGVRDRAGVLAVIAKLRSVEAETARDAAITLGGLPADAGAVEALAAVVANKDGFFHSVVRAAAAAALGKLGDRRAVEALIAGVRDPMAEASEEAVKALGLLADARALPALRAVIANADGFFLENVRKSAQEAVRRIG